MKSRAAHTWPHPRSDKSRRSHHRRKPAGNRVPAFPVHSLARNHAVPRGAIPSRGGETVDGCGCRTQENESIRATPPTTPCLLSGDTSENIGLSGISAHGFSCVFIIATSRSGYSREPTPPRPDAMMRAMRTSPQCKPSRTGHGRRSAPESERAIVSAPTPATGNRLPRRIRRMQHGREANDPSMRSEARRRGRQGNANPTFPCLLSGDTLEIKGFPCRQDKGFPGPSIHPPFAAMNHVRILHACSAYMTRRYERGRMMIPAFAPVGRSTGS